ncbi:MAG: type I-U CRISPR-associated RAMP protein Csb1/Cas7u [Planctomycetes bacterium]|nr:type I-U CRISPR-associated RAMP protein Csb1/Cas7u [Planctomycetota bacterium]
MSDEQDRTYKAFDDLLDPKGPVVLVGKQLLKVGSFDDEKTEIVFPPSYANPSEKKDDPPVYNIDPPYDPKDPLTHNNVCVLDSIPSQANRMEPLFGEPPYASLVPQYKVKFNDELPIVNVTQIGHRIADAAFRGTELRSKIVEAFKEYAKGNAKKLAEIGPTSLVFGVWDSRGTGVKVPRLINSIIRAFNVRSIKRSAQYTPPIKYEQEGFIPAGLEGKPADHGLADVPSSHKIGGVQVFGEIRRDFSLNLELLREIKGASDDETRKLQRYILGLALLAFTATQKTCLRQGCQLLPIGEPTWKQFSARGVESPWAAPPNITELTQSAASTETGFGVAQPKNQPLVFDKNLLKASIDADAKKKADKKAVSAGGPIDNLKNLVNELEPVRGDRFSTAKTAKLTKLQEAVTAIESDSAADGNLKTIAANLKPLLIADAGAAERKMQMLALFPAASDTAPSEQADQIPEAAQ